VNTHAEYRRHSHQPAETHAPTRDVEDVASQLARHRDPSLASSAPTTPPDRSKRIAWVRPTELAGFASPLIGRGIDLQAELIRRARRAPMTTGRRARRSASHAFRTQEPSAPHQEGLHL